MTFLIGLTWAAPDVLSPADGVWTAEHDETLYVVDPGEPVTFRADTPLGSFESDPVVGDGVRVAWDIPVTLPEDTETCWEAWTDPADPSHACFFVNSTNDPPTPPALVLSGSTVTVTPGEDPEFRDVWTDVRLDGVASEHAGPSDLSVDVPEFFRLEARTHDGIRNSAWVVLEVEPEPEPEDTGEVVVEDTGGDGEPTDTPEPTDVVATGGHQGGGGVTGCAVAPLAAGPWLLALALVRRKRTTRHTA